jgi:hypothetical protein
LLVRVLVVPVLVVWEPEGLGVGASALSVLVPVLVVPVLVVWDPG